MNSYLAYLCGIQGHVRTGVGIGTGAGDILWAAHCDRCGADLTSGASHTLQKIPAKETRC